MMQRYLLLFGNSQMVLFPPQSVVLVTKIDWFYALLYLLYNFNDNKLASGFDSTINCSLVIYTYYGEWCHSLPSMFLTNKHIQGCQSVKLGDTEKASAIPYKTSCSKPNGHLDSTTSFHKVPTRNLQEHCLSEPSFLVNLTFPKSMLVMFVSYAILLQDFFCHPTEMWLYHLITFTSLLFKK